MILLRTFLVVWAVGLAAAGTEALAQQLAPAPEASTGRTAKSLGTAREIHGRGGKPARRGGGARDAARPAAARSMRRSRCSSCSTSSSRRAPASAAAPSWCIGDAGRGRCRPSTAARRRPRRRSPSAFIGPDGKPMKFYDAVVGGRSVGVPGTPAAARDRAQELGQAALAAAVRAGDPPRRGGLRDLAAPQRPARAGEVPAERSRRPRLFLPGGRQRRSRSARS